MEKMVQTLWVLQGVTFLCYVPFVCVSHSVVSASLRPHGLLPTRLVCLWDSPGMNTEVSCHFLLQGIFLTQGLNQGLLSCRQILYHLSYQGSPQTLWVYEGASLLPLLGQPCLHLYIAALWVCNCSPGSALYHLAPAHSVWCSLDF